MKRLLVAACAVSLLISAHAAASSSVGAVGAPAHADLETSAVTPMPAAALTDHLFKLTLTLDATTNNNVTVALGSGAQSDPDGTALIIGWNAGEWSVRGDNLRRAFSTADGNRTNAAPRTLTVAVRMSRGWQHDDEPPISVTVTEQSGGLTRPVTFAGIPADTLLAWFDPRGWDAMRVVSRGQVDASAVSATATFYPDGTHMILR